MTTRITFAKWAISAQNPDGSFNVIGEFKIGPNVGQGFNSIELKISNPDARTDWELAMRTGKKLTVITE